MVTAAAELAPPERDPHPPRRRRRRRRILGHPLAHLAAALLTVALVQSFAVKMYQVPSASMEPALLPGDRILVDRLGVSGEPAPGDVVVFDRPASWRDAPPSQRPPWRVIVGWLGDSFGFGPGNSDTLVKRVVAGPGQTAACCDAAGRITVDGAPLDEPHVTNDFPFERGALDCESTPRSQRCFAPVRLGGDELLVLGDNRANSVDSLAACRADPAADMSSCARPITQQLIIGEVFLRVWPFTRWGSP